MPEPQVSSLTSTGETHVQADGEHQRLHRRMGRLLEFFWTLLWAHKPMDGTSNADNPQATWRVLNSYRIDHMIISNSSDVEEITPPLIAHNPAVLTDEATITILASPNSMQNALLSPASIHPAEVTGLLLHPPPNGVTGISLHPPLLPLLAVPNLVEEEVQVYWDFKKDRSHAAEVAGALCTIVRVQHWKLETANLWVQCWINGMLALCHLFSSPSSKHTWTGASELTATTLGHGMTFTCKLRQWVIEFKWQGMVYDALPLTQHGQFDTHCLFDEDLTRIIQANLFQLCKTKQYLKAEDIIDFIISPEMQAAMGTRTMSILKRTAHHWLKRMDRRYGRAPNGMYIDSHEHEDVVEYHTWFLAEYSRLERWMRRYCQYLEVHLEMNASAQCASYLEAM